MTSNSMITHQTSQDTRTHVVGELYDTERSYVESLQILIEVSFQKFLRQVFQVCGTGEPTNERMMKMEWPGKRLSLVKEGMGSSEARSRGAA